MARGKPPSLHFNSLFLNQSCIKIVVGDSAVLADIIINEMHITHFKSGFLSCPFYGLDAISLIIIHVSNMYVFCSKSQVFTMKIPTDFEVAYQNPCNITATMTMHRKRIFLHIDSWISWT